MALPFASIRFLLSKLLTVSAAILIVSAMSELFFSEMSTTIGIIIGLIIWAVLFLAFFKKFIGGFVGFLLAEVAGFIAGLLIFRGLNDLFFTDLSAVVKLVGGIIVLFLIFFLELRGRK